MGSQIIEIIKTKINIMSTEQKILLIKVVCYLLSLSLVSAAASMKSVSVVLGIPLINV